MHPLQRRSLFAILSLAEQAIQQAKAMLAQDPADVHASAPRNASAQPGDSEYLSETEEEQIERMLEEDRLKMKEEDERRLGQLWGEKE